MVVGKRPRIHSQVAVEPEIVGKCAELGMFRNFHEGRCTEPEFSADSLKLQFMVGRDP